MYKITYQGPEADDVYKEELPTWGDAQKALGELIDTIVPGVVRITMQDLLRHKAAERPVHMTDASHTFTLDPL